jgi:hypothetical protein
MQVDNSNDRGSGSQPELNAASFLEMLFRAISEGQVNLPARRAPGLHSQAQNPS